MNFTKTQLNKWSKYNLKPVQFPDLTISEDFNEAGYVKPEKWFYDKIKEGKIAKDSATLKGCWYLIDFTVSADYNDGKQVYKKDPLAPLITKLRQAGKIGKHNETPLGSRFSITHDEWTTVLLPELSKKLGVELRLERAIEFNYIVNKLDKKRDKFNVWEWFNDIFEDSGRLLGGYRGHGGLADVDYDWHDFRGRDVAARPLGVLGNLDSLPSDISSLEIRVKTLEDKMNKLTKIINLVE